MMQVFCVQWTGNLVAYRRWTWNRLAGLQNYQDGCDLFDIDNYDW
jgi:hypothetical protein